AGGEQGVVAGGKGGAGFEPDAVAGFEGGVGVGGGAGDEVVDVGGVVVGGVGGDFRIVAGDDGEVGRRGEDVDGSAEAGDPAVGVEVAAAAEVDGGAGFLDEVRGGEDDFLFGQAAGSDVDAARVDPDGA